MDILLSKKHIWIYLAHFILHVFFDFPQCIVCFVFIDNFYLEVQKRR